jgi:integrase
MPIRERNGKWEWRFKVDGHEWSRITELAATERNRNKAQRIEADAYRLVVDGRSAELTIGVRPFTSAAEAFEEWTEGEYSEHPNSSARLKVSMTSAKLFFKKQPLSSVTKGDLENFRTWRRRTHNVRPVTLRHDLHALSLLFQYGIQHQWCRFNPVRDVTVPSDKESVRVNVLSRAQEDAYFSACEALRLEKAAARRMKEARGLQDLSDLHRLMILQGCRPEELRELQQANVDLEHWGFSLSGKTAAATRKLKMRKEVHEIFTRRLETPNRWVFPSTKNPSTHIGNHQRLHAAVLKRSGVLCVPYDFRHTFASRAANEENVPLTILAAIMGHANLRSILKYVHVQQHDMDRELVRLDVPKIVPAAGPPDGTKNRDKLGNRGKVGEEANPNVIM